MDTNGNRHQTGRRAPFTKAVQAHRLCYITRVGIFPTRVACGTVSRDIQPGQVRGSEQQPQAHNARSAARNDVCCRADAQEWDLLILIAVGRCAKVEKRKTVDLPQHEPRHVQQSKREREEHEPKHEPEHQQAAREGQGRPKARQAVYSKAEATSTFIRLVSEASGRVE